MIFLYRPGKNFVIGRARLETYVMCPGILFWDAKGGRSHGGAQSHLITIYEGMACIF